MHWGILMFSSFFCAFLRIVAAFTHFTVDLSVRLFGVTLSWKQRVLKWRWFFQPANFLVTFSTGDNPRRWWELAQEENKRGHKHTQWKPVLNRDIVMNSRRSCYSLCHLMQVTWHYTYREIQSAGEDREKWSIYTEEKTFLATGCFWICIFGRASGILCCDVRHEAFWQ